MHLRPRLTKDPARILGRNRSFRPPAQDTWKGKVFVATTPLLPLRTSALPQHAHFASIHCLAIHVESRVA